MSPPNQPRRQSLRLLGQPAPEYAAGYMSQSHHRIARRQSLRLLGQPAQEYAPANRPKSYNRINSRKRARRCPSGSPDSTSALHQVTTTRKTTILNLPDEAIELIFAYLTMSDTSGTFRRPRDAFCLAVTNSRLLRLYGAPITRVILRRKYVFVSALTYDHMLCAIRLAGRDLRELHLQSFRFDMAFWVADIIERLSTLCPRLEKLDVVDDHLHDGLHGIDKLVDLKLRSLSISDPYPQTLRSMVRSPEELCLTRVCPERANDLLPVLRLPLKRLYLQIVDIRVPPCISECLNEVCPKIEELTVKLKYYECDNCYELRGENYGGTAMYRLLNTPRSERSTCRKLVLCTGDYCLTDLLRHVHPEAVVEISQWFQTYVYDGKDVPYAKALPLWDDCLDVDLSKLSEISVTYVYGSVSIHPIWKSLLVGKHFSRVWVENGDEMGGLYLEADVVEIPLEGVTFTNWKWLGDVKEVRITEWYGYAPERKELLRSLANLLDTFQGKLVSMEYSPGVSLKKDADSDVGLFDFVVRTLNAFEARGGDASAVRGIVERVKWT